MSTKLYRARFASLARNPEESGSVPTESMRLTSLGRRWEGTSHCQVGPDCQPEKGGGGTPAAAVLGRGLLGLGGRKGKELGSACCAGPKGGKGRGRSTGPQARIEREGEVLFVCFLFLSFIPKLISKIIFLNHFELFLNFSKTNHLNKSYARA